MKFVLRKYSRSKTDEELRITRMDVEADGETVGTLYLGAKESSALVKGNATWKYGEPAIPEE